jgi:hypothetical protein
VPLRERKKVQALSRPSSGIGLTSRIVPISLTSSASQPLSESGVGYFLFLPMSQSMSEWMFRPILVML